MTEMYAATRDALSHALVPVVQMTVKEMPKYVRPWYLPPAAEPVRDLAKGRAQVAALAARYPRNMRGFKPPSEG
jgi:hypothetical protein